MSLARLSVRRPVGVSMVFLCVVMLGAISFSRLPIDLLRGFALLARTAGLLGQLAEKRRRTIGMDVYRTVDGNATYVDPREPES